MRPQWLLDTRVASGSRYVDTVAPAFIELIRRSYEYRLCDCVRAAKPPYERDRAQIAIDH